MATLRSPCPPGAIMSATFGPGPRPVGAVLAELGPEAGLCPSQAGQGGGPCLSLHALPLLPPSALLQV